MTLQGLLFLGGVAVCGFLVVKFAAPKVRANAAVRGTKPPPLLSWRNSASMHPMERRARTLLLWIIGLLMLFVFGLAMRKESPNLAVVLYLPAFVGFFWVFAARYRLLRDYKEIVAEEAGARPATAPPIWPPRKPDDWGQEVQNAHRRAMRRYQEKANMASKMSQSGVSGTVSSPPVMPAIPSWEAHHAREQAADFLQIRWAQNEMGEWVKVLWGDRGRPPADGGPLPVFQSMKRLDSGTWIWTYIGRNPLLDWQAGPPRMVEFEAMGRDLKPFMALRPLGSPLHQDVPPPLAPDGGHGDARFRGPDDLEAGGFVPRR